MRWRKIKQKNSSGQTKPKKPVVHYARFRERALAFVTDIFMIGIPITLLIMILFGHNEMMNSAGGVDVILDPEKAEAHAPNPMASLLQMLLYLATFVLFWSKSGQTPGMKMMQIKVVDAQSLQPASVPQLVLRFLGYFLSFITLVGFFTGLFRKDGRALHDLISRTAVISV